MLVERVREYWKVVKLQDLGLMIEWMRLKRTLLKLSGRDIYNFIN